MRISFFNYHYDIEGDSRGAAAQVYQIATGLEELGHIVDVQFRAKKTTSEKQEGNQKANKIGWLRRWGHVPKLILRNFRFIKEEKKLLTEFKPDLLFVFGSYCNFSGLRAAKSCRLPFIYFCDAPLEYEYSTFYTHYKPYALIGRSLEGMVIRGAAQIIAVSKYQQQHALDFGVAKEKIHLVPNGVDHHKFYPMEPDSQLLARLNLQGKTVAGYIGNFQFFSEITAFADVLSRICSKHNNLTFLFLGHGEKSTALQQAIKHRGFSDRAIFHEAVAHDQVPAFLSLMDVVIAPYRGDYNFYNSPLKVIEYMGAGRAVVASELGQICDMIEHGKNGMLFPWDNLELMGEQIEQLVGDKELRKALGLNARKTVIDAWTWDHQFKKIEAVFKLAKGEEL